MTQRDPALEYARKVLIEKKTLLEALAPGMERPDLTKWELRALDKALELLHPPQFSLSPFL